MMGRLEPAALRYETRRSESMAGVIVSCRGAASIWMGVPGAKPSEERRPPSIQKRGALCAVPMVENEISCFAIASSGKGVPFRATCPEIRDRPRRFSRRGTAMQGSRPPRREPSGSDEGEGRRSRKVERSARRRSAPA